jgi:hypothetical protein
MPTEAQERKATNNILDVISNWMKPGTNEGISFLVTRLSDDLFTDSFTGAGDMSLFTPSAHRGRLKSQLSDAYVLDSGGGLPHKFPIQFAFDLDTGTITGSWTNPVTGVNQTPSLVVTFFKTATRPEGKYYLFYADSSSDDAGYSLSFLLL